MKTRTGADLQESAGLHTKSHKHKRWLRMDNYCRANSTVTSKEKPLVCFNAERIGGGWHQCWRINGVMERMSETAEILKVLKLRSICHS